MAFHWQADDDPTLNAGPSLNDPTLNARLGSFVILQGIKTSIAKKPYSFVIFQDGGPDPLPPPLWIRVCNAGVASGARSLIFNPSLTCEKMWLRALVFGICRICKQPMIRRAWASAQSCRPGPLPLAYTNKCKYIGTLGL